MGERLESKLSSDLRGDVGGMVRSPCWEAPRHMDMRNYTITGPGKRSIAVSGDFTFISQCQ